MQLCQNKNYERDTFQVTHYEKNKVPHCETSTPPHDVLTHYLWQWISATHLALLGVLGNALDRVLDNLIEARLHHKRLGRMVFQGPSQPNLWFYDI